MGVRRLAMDESDQDSDDHFGHSGDCNKNQVLGNILGIFIFLKKRGARGNLSKIYLQG